MQQRVRALLLLHDLLLLVLPRLFRRLLSRVPCAVQLVLRLLGGPELGGRRSAQASSGLPPQTLRVHDLPAAVQPSGGRLLHRQGERGPRPEQREHVQKHPGEFVYDTQCSWNN